MSAKVDALDLQLKEQLKSNSLLLSKLVAIRGEGREDVRVHAVLDLLDDPELEVADVLRREKILLDDLKAKEKKSEASESMDSPVQKVLQPIESRHNEPAEGHLNHQPVIKEVRPGIEQSKDLEEEEEEEEDEEDEEEVNEDKKEEEDNTGARTSADDDANEDIGVEEKDVSGAGDHNVIPLLLFSCNRPTVNRSLTPVLLPITPLFI